MRIKSLSVLIFSLPFAVSAQSTDDTMLFDWENSQILQEELERLVEEPSIPQATFSIGDTYEGRLRERDELVKRLVESYGLSYEGLETDDQNADVIEGAGGALIIIPEAYSEEGLNLNLVFSDLNTDFQTADTNNLFESFSSGELITPELWSEIFENSSEDVPDLNRLGNEIDLSGIIGEEAPEQPIDPFAIVGADGSVKGIVNRRLDMTPEEFILKSRELGYTVVPHIASTGETIVSSITQLVMTALYRMCGSAFRPSEITFNLTAGAALFAKLEGSATVTIDLEKSCPKFIEIYTVN